MEEPDGRCMMFRIQGGGFDRRSKPSFYLADLLTAKLGHVNQRRTMSTSFIIGTVAFMESPCFRHSQTLQQTISGWTTSLTARHFIGTCLANVDKDPHLDPPSLLPKKNGKKARESGPGYFRQQ